jgi:hypothetical protein
VWWIRIHWIQIQIRIQHFKWILADPIPDPGFWQQKNEKNTAEIFFFLIVIYLPLGLLKGRQSNRRNLPPTKKNIQYFKKL